MSIGRRWAPLAIGVVTAELAVAWSLFIPHPPRRGWHVGFDVWIAWRSAQYIADGALGYVYEAVPYPTGALPLFAVLLAPFTFIANALRLQDGYPTPVPHPSAWLLLGPVCSLVAVPFAYALRWAVDHFVGRWQAGLVLVAMTLTVPAPFFWGHYEDVLALSCVLAALVLAHRGDVARSALVIGVGVAFKQWALVIVPLLVLGPWRREWLRSLFIAGALPGALAAFVLAVDWAHASKALASPTYYLPGPHRHVLPWLVDRQGDSPTSLARAGFLLIAIVFAVWTARRLRSDLPQRLLAAASVILVLRALTEVLPYSYYVVPGTLLAVIAEATAGRVPYRTIICGAALLLLFRWTPAPWAWWAVYWSLGGGLIAITIRAAFRSGAPGYQWSPKLNEEPVQLSTANRG